MKGKQIIHEARLIGEDADRAEKLRKSGLSKMQAIVASLKEKGESHSQIAAQLGIKKNTVDEHARRANEKIDQAKSLIDETSVEITDYEVNIRDESVPGRDLLASTRITIDGPRGPATGCRRFQLSGSSVSELRQSWSFRDQSIERETEDWIVSDGIDSADEFRQECRDVLLATPATDYKHVVHKYFKKYPNHIHISVSRDEIIEAIQNSALNDLREFKVCVREDGSTEIVPKNATEYEDNFCIPVQSFVDDHHTDIDQMRTLQKEDPDAFEQACDGWAKAIELHNKLPRPHLQECIITVEYK